LKKEEEGKKKEGKRERRERSLRRNEESALISEDGKQNPARHFERALRARFHESRGQNTQN